jgi:hypothetical protein
MSTSISVKRCSFEAPTDVRVTQGKVEAHEKLMKLYKLSGFEKSYLCQVNWVDDTVVQLGDHLICVTVRYVKI